MKLHRLTTQLVAGAILTLPLWVHAAGLGKLTVKSALGQPLSAEIELLVADKAELDSLNVALASGQAFKDAQIEYAPILSSLQFAIVKDAGGKSLLKLTSSKAVDDPFMDMLIELNWPSGRLLREYTVLLDPPGVVAPQAVAPVAISVPAVKPAVAPVSGAAKPVAIAAPAAAPAAEKPAAAAAPAAVAAPTKPSPMPELVQVKRGDTLSKIANQVRPANVSLEQALVALFHENSLAFDGKNMNRLKAGQKLKVPAAEAMAGVDGTAAAREIRLQAADWQAYRAKLAESVAAQPEEPKAAAGRTVVGKVTPKVEDKAQAKTEEAKDVLKLSRAAAPAAAAAATAKTQAEQKAAQAKAEAQAKAQAEAEDRAAREKALKESAARAASLEKQIQDMQKLVDMKEKQAAAAAAAGKGAAKPPVVAAPKVKVKALPPPVPVEQENWYDGLLQNPLYWIGGLGAVVLGGLLWWMMAGGRLRKKKAHSATDSIMTVTDMQPSVVESATTGGVVNTGDTSFLTDFSQAGLAEIDTHDVDPIAEADVYMAYGRDAQAEEILKEALTKSPERHEIRLKLLEIYAARKNVTAFEDVAGQLYAALGGQPGQIWDKAVEMGRAIDPRNPLYGGAAQGNEEPNTVFSPAAPKLAPEPAAPARPAAEPAEAAVAAEPVLDFVSQTPAMELDMDLSAPEPAAVAEKAGEAAPAAPEKNELDFDLSGFELNLPEAAPSTAPAPTAAPAMDFSGLDLNLNDLGGGDAFDEVTTKLDLARAYLEMGDKEGAREILEEVMSEGNAKQKSDAEGIMATL